MSEDKQDQENGDEENNTGQSNDNEQERELDLDNIQELFPLVYHEDDLRNIEDLLSKHIKKIIERNEICNDYLILFIYSSYKSVSENTADRIYNAIPDDNDKPILLVINNRGGRIEPAYLLSKTCKENSPKFSVAVPRRAKSAATLICLGANEIHMGSMSELGPIDPQIGNLPALGLSSSLESLASVVSEYPNSSKMFADYLSSKLDLRILGYFERVSESAKQYAIRLLKDKNLSESIGEVAHNLVYAYKDHSFVIDKEEAQNFLGDHIKVNTNEYEFSNEIHEFMGKLNAVADFSNNQAVSIVGNYNGIMVHDKKED